jgi:hypothetical protein
MGIAGNRPHKGTCWSLPPFLQRVHARELDYDAGNKLGAGIEIWAVFAGYFELANKESVIFLPSVIAVCLFSVCAFSF